MSAGGQFGLAGGGRKRREWRKGNPDMSDETRNYWWLNANPAIWDYSTFSPGEEHGCTQVNEDGRPRKIQMCFPQVRPGDWVLGYSDSPKKQLSCLCKITRPLENGVFHFAKVLDFPNPVPSSGWTGEPVLKHFHFRGSLFKLSQEQWDGFVRLVKERNPGMTIPPAPNVLELERKLDAYLSAFTPTPEMLEQRQKAQEQRDAFVHRFPLDKLATLTPEQYCIGKGDKDNFCWWVERGTTEMGKYFPGTSRSYGMYFRKEDASIAMSKLVRKFWGSKTVVSNAEVLRHCILEPLSEFVAAHGRAQGSHVIGNGFSLKILELYHPEEFIRINSVIWLAKIVEAFHLPLSSDMGVKAFYDSQKNRYPVADNLAIKGFYDRKKQQFPDRDFSQMEFIRFIRDMLKLNDKENKDISQSAPNFPSAPMKGKHPLNTILCGPPGTGKTHDVVNRVFEIVTGKVPEDYAVAKEEFDSLKDQKRVEFVTFHQSYGYEDFIEGIRPVLDEESGTFAGYELHDGVFKEFCKRALVPVGDDHESFGIRKDPTIWKVSLERTGDNATRTECMENGHIRIGWDDYGPAITEQSFANDTAGKGVLDAFMNRMQIGDLVVSCYSASETDAIGVVTGDYEWDDSFSHFKRVRKVKWLVKGIRDDIRAINHGKTMVLATVYRLNIALPDILALVKRHRAENGVLQPAQQPYVFVIDEINRGNISKIFGELITLVEPSKRLGAEEEARVVLPYSAEEFGVPSNVYILGTMNTADRSIALLDTALRRRFDFIEMMPRPELLPEQGPDGIDLRTMLRIMNERIEFLLDREHMIGHAYFMGEFAENPTMAGLAGIFRNRIVPLLQEYFFEDYGKIRLVLGDTSKKEADQFVTEAKGLDKRLFPGVDRGFGGPVDEDRVVYRIQQEAFLRPEAYRGIYASPETGKKAVE